MTEGFLQPPVILLVHHLKQFMISRMMTAVHFSQAINHHMGIPDGRLDAGVSQKFLDVADTGAVFKKVGSGRMPHRVGGDLPLIHAEAPQKIPEPLADAGGLQVATLGSSSGAQKHPGIPLADPLSQVKP